MQREKILNIELKKTIRQSNVIQEQVLDRAEKVEEFCMDLEEKHESANEQINALKKEIEEEKSQKATFLIVAPLYYRGATYV